MAEALVTGGTGLLGQRVVAELERRGWDVRVLSRRGPAGDEAPGGGAPDGRARRWRGDLASGAGLDEAVAGVQTIVHCATGSGARTPRGLREVDLAGTRRLLLAARAARVSHSYTRRSWASSGCPSSTTAPSSRPRRSSRVPACRGRRRV